MIENTLTAREIGLPILKTISHFFFINCLFETKEKLFMNLRHYFIKDR